MIAVQNLTYKYQNGKNNALNNISLTVNDGEFLGIIGESGAGKSTLIYAINGIIPHHFRGDFYGSVIIDQADTFDITPGELSLKIGTVLQDIDSQMVSSVVEDEILFGLENFSVSKEEIEERLLSSLKAVGISDLRHRSIDSLSGGQKQKVAIAAIIALRPKVLLMDEPTSELDPISSVQIYKILKELNKNYGLTIIVVEQKIMLLAEFIDKLVVMKDGRLVMQGEKREVLGKVTELESAGVNCPRVLTLTKRLQEAGVYNGDICATVDEAVVMVRGLIND